MKSYKTIKACRVCGGTQLKRVLNLGEMYISTFVDEPGKDIGKAPLELVVCRNPVCELLQLRHTATQELLYSGHYWYRSFTNEMIRNDLRSIAWEAQVNVQLQKGDTVLDIGANDGTLLSFFPDWINRIAVEPAKNLYDDLLTSHVEVIQDFWENVEWKRDKAKVITAIGMFYDSEDPNKFIAKVKEALSDDGVFISQLMTLRPMIESADLGNICHEHLEYYNYKSLVYLFEQNGLQIFRVEENRINGGSYRLFAQHLKEGSAKYVEPKPDYEVFSRRVQVNKENARKVVRDFLAEGKQVYGYGASTKGNTILQFYGLDSSQIMAIADRSPEKIGKYTVGTNIPIVAEEDGRKNAKVFLVLPWGFLDAFCKREEEWLKQGGCFVTHTPKVTIYYYGTT